MYMYVYSEAKTYGNYLAETDEDTPLAIATKAHVLKSQ
jgi:hypothetical protein